MRGNTASVENEQCEETTKPKQLESTKALMALAGGGDAERHEDNLSVKKNLTLGASRQLVKLG